MSKIYNLMEHNTILSITRVQLYFLYSREKLIFSSVPYVLYVCMYVYRGVNQPTYMIRMLCGTA